MRIYIIFIQIIMPLIIYCQDSYQDTLVNCKIIDNISYLYDGSFPSKLNIYKVFTGTDTILLVSKNVDTILTKDYKEIEIGRKYLLLLKFVPIVWMFAYNNQIYNRTKDSTMQWMNESDLMMNLGTRNIDLFYEQKHFRPYRIPGLYLFYTSTQMIDNYVPLNTLIE